VAKGEGQGTWGGDGGATTRLLINIIIIIIEFQLSFQFTGRPSLC
jgi:hypothetical protein